MSRAMVIDELRRARGLIEDLRGWTSGAYARDERGAPVRPTDPSAKSFCAKGACMCVGVCFSHLTAVAHTICVEHGLAAPENESAIAWVNDQIGHAATLEMFDRAIERGGHG